MPTVQSETTNTESWKTSSWRIEPYNAALLDYPAEPPSAEENLEDYNIDKIQSYGDLQIVETPFIHELRDLQEIVELLSRSAHLGRSPELTEFARIAIERLRTRQEEDVADWANRLSADTVDADD